MPEELSDEALAEMRARAATLAGSDALRWARKAVRLKPDVAVWRRDDIDALVQAFSRFDDGDRIVDHLVQALADHPILVAEVERLRKLAGYDKGLIWDADDAFVTRTWAELKAKIESTHGGLGIVAADFDELLRYGDGGPGIRHRRSHFTRLVSEATAPDDIELLAQILAVMLIDPWRANLQGGWFIHRLRKGDELKEFDAARACQVLNALYDVNVVTASVLMETLREFITDEGVPRRRRLLDLIAEAGQLRGEVAMLMRPAKVFLSYAREDAETADRLYDDLTEKGLKVWKDTHDLLPGEPWETKIRRTLTEYEFAVICLSSASVRKRGFFQVEVKVAARMQEERSESDVFIIPAKIDASLHPNELPLSMAALHIADLSADWDAGVEAIARTIIQHRRHRPESA